MFTASVQSVYHQPNAFYLSKHRYPQQTKAGLFLKNLLIKIQSHKTMCTHI